MPVAPSSSASAEPVAERAIQEDTRHELLRLAYQGLNGSTLAAGGVALAFACALGLRNPTLTLGLWLAAMLGIVGLRLRLVRAFEQRSSSTTAPEVWELRLAMAMTASAAGWGASVWLFPTLEHGNPLGVMHVLLLCCLILGAIRQLLPVKWSSLAYLLAVMLPLAARILTHGDMTSVLLGACVLVFIAYVGSTTLQNHEALAHALRQRFEREALARELTAEIARRESHEAELREARERAESASRAKGEFLATISHEIRTPMNGVLGMLRVVRDTKLTAEQRGYLKTASDSAEALLLLLNDVLDFSKIEAGRLELEHAPFPPAKIVRAVTDLLHARARDKSLQFEVVLADNLPGAIVGDAPRLRQILFNLVGNAIKFTERGRVELAVSCPERTSTRAVLHFTVTDTGIGIDSAALDRLFKPFTQADSSMSRRYGGTGLGLAISQRLAQAMGGALHVQSTLNQGSTFRFVLPCALPEVAELPRAPAPPRFVAPSLRARVLVVEDDTVNQQVIDLFLQKLNVTPTFAPDGEAALAHATSAPFDLVLMDLQLPGIDGLETTRRIRRHLGATPLKIIALTANASTHMREACLAAGMDDFLSKPVRFELLAGVLQQHLHEAGRARAVPSPAS